MSLKIYKFVTYLCMIFFSAAATFIVADIIYAHWGNSNPWESQKLHMNYGAPHYYKPYPYIMFKSEPNSQLGENDFANEIGYRGPVPTIPKKESEYRVFILGGSTVLGWQEQKTLPTNLQKVFSEKGYKNVRVYNFGAASSGSGQALARIVYEVSDFQPDLIIAYNGANDFEHPFFRDPRPGYPFNFLVHEANPIFLKNPSDFPLLATLLYRSAILRRYLKRYFEEAFASRSELARKAGKGSDQWFEQIVSTYLTNMRKMSVVSKSFGSEFLGIIQPMAYFKDKLVGIETKHPYNSKNNEYHRLRNLFYEKIKEQEDFQLADFTNLFKEYDKEVFVDSCHVHEEFNYDIALKIVDLVLSKDHIKRKIEALH